LSHDGNEAIILKAQQDTYRRAGDSCGCSASTSKGWIWL